MEAGSGLCLSFWKNLSSWTDLEHVFSKSRGCSVEGDPLPAEVGLTSYGTLLPPLGGRRACRAPSGRRCGRSARPGISRPGTSLPPSLEFSGASRLGLTTSLCSLLQAETPLITTCRQNAPPAAGYYCPARRSACAAVRLHNRQCECLAGWAGGAGVGGIQSSTKARASLGQDSACALPLPPTRPP